jgi:hypothetical protein
VQQITATPASVSNLILKKDLTSGDGSGMMARMNKTEQLIALAELDGWTENSQTWFSPNGCRYAKFSNHGRVIHASEIWPDYTGSRDAILPLIAKLYWPPQALFVHQICSILKINFVGADMYELLYAVMLATPAQLAEAVLRDQGKWND